MILYKMAKWMEEWTDLDSMIRESQGDVRFLRVRKEQVEQTMRMHARQWLGRAGHTLRPTDIPDLYVLEPVDDSVLSQVL